MTLEVLQYQGRVPKRAGSLAKRNKILDATLAIIQTEGLRGVRHRAVAELAEVPLSATTYYFKDINELIVDSFVYFVEVNFAKQEQAFQTVTDDFSSENFKSIDTPQKIEYFRELLFHYIVQQVSDVDKRLVERSFIQYASRIPELATKVLTINRYLEQQVADIFELLQVDNAKFKAHLLIAFILLTEERALLSKSINEQELSDKIQILLEDLLG